MRRPRRCGAQSAFLIVDCAGNYGCGGVAAVVSLSALAAVGLAQDPIYGEQPPTTSPTGVSGVSGSVPDTRHAKLLKCIAKAQTKYGDNRPKRKAAIRKCRKKFG